MSQQRKNEECWQQLFEVHDILNAIEQRGYFYISSNQINQVHQARLMTKFDTIQALPALFKEHSINIIAVSNGQYLLYQDPNMTLYSEVNMDLEGKPELYVEEEMPELETLQFSSTMSESSAIDYAHHSGLLNSCFGESQLMLTTRGRFFSKVFAVQLSGTLSQEIKSVQIEVDAGFEGENGFHIVEAKCGVRESFNIRQLYFPYRHFSSILNKPVYCWLLLFSDGRYYMYRYEFLGDSLDYQISERRVFELSTQVKDTSVEITTLIDEIYPIVPEVPFPQANQVSKLLDAVIALSHRSLNKEGLATYFEMEERQGDYYGNALRYLGLASKNEDFFELTDTGIALTEASTQLERHIVLLKGMLGTHTMHELIKRRIEKKDISRSYILESLKQTGLQDSTIQRRAQTIASWLNWVEQTFLSKQFTLF